MDVLSEDPQLFFQIPSEKRLRDEFGFTPPSCEEESFRHSGWKPLRQRIFKALLASGCTASTIESFACCGACTSIWFHDESGEIRLKGNYCHNRFCQPCSRARGFELQRLMQAKLPTKTILRFCTLTLKHSALPLVDILQRLRDAFATLRNRKWWKDRVTGGVCVLEVKLSKSGLWHPHLHMILEGKYMLQEELSQLWLAITGDSYIVDIRRCDSGGNDVADLCSYLTKYVTKPAGLDVMTDDQKLVEYILAVKGQRILNFLGSWRGLMKDDDDGTAAVTAENGWRHLFRFNELVQKARAGEDFARRILDGLTRKLEVTPDISPPLIPDGLASMAE